MGQGADRYAHHLPGGRRGLGWDCMITDAIGWTATVIFMTSYFFRDQKTLRLVQGAASCLWMSYGFAIHSAPVIGSSFIVIAAAPCSEMRAAVPLQRELLSTDL